MRVKGEAFYCILEFVAECLVPIHKAWLPGDSPGNTFKVGIKVSIGFHLMALKM